MKSQSSLIEAVFLTTGGVKHEKCKNFVSILSNRGGVSDELILKQEIPESFSLNPL